MGAELDPQLVESDKTERSRRFATVRRGYDPSAVDDFLKEVASNIEALETELHKDPATAGVAPEGTDPAQVLSSGVGDTPEPYMQRIARLGAAAEREIERMLAETKAEAATIIAEAKSEADRIRIDAEGGAGRSVEEARAFLTQVEEDAGRMLSGVVERRGQMIQELQKMQEQLLSVTKDLDRVLNPGSDADVPGSSTGGVTADGP